MDCCKWKIWEVLTASKANSLSLLMLAKKSQCAQRPFVTHIFLSRQHGIQVATFCHHFLKHIFILQSTDFHFVSFHVVLQITVSHLHCKKEGIKCTRKNKKKSRVVVLIIKSICVFVCFFFHVVITAYRPSITRFGKCGFHIHNIYSKLMWLFTFHLRSV